MASPDLFDPALPVRDAIADRPSDRSSDGSRRMHPGGPPQRPSPGIETGLHDVRTIPMDCLPIVDSIVLRRSASESPASEAQAEHTEYGGSREGDEREPTIALSPNL